MSNNHSDKGVWNHLVWYPLSYMCHVNASRFLSSETEQGSIYRLLCAAALYTLNDLVQCSGSNLTPSLWKHVSCFSLFLPTSNLTLIRTLNQGQ